jgi:hypothetical protein
MIRTPKCLGPGISYDKDSISREIISRGTVVWNGVRYDESCPAK